VGPTAAAAAAELASLWVLLRAVAATAALGSHAGTTATARTSVHANGATRENTSFGRAADAAAAATGAAAAAQE
jgi:hypothetical protein